MTDKKINIPEVLAAKRWSIEKHIEPLEHSLKDSLARLILVSDYASRHIQLSLDILTNDGCISLLSREEYFSLINLINLEQSQALYSAELRHYRNTHFLRLLILEQAGLINTEQVMRAWSDCADALIVHSLKYCQKTLSKRYGVPRDEIGNEVELFGLAMGKLGGRELNYSSDIDLIFTFNKTGDTDGEEGISNQQFFSKVIQLFMQLLQNKTAEGFVFRVDLRLRPNGDSGALVLSLAAMETYYQEQGRDWERYAMVKARLVQESLDVNHPWFEQLIVPFVYRRYVDFSVIESLRSMKAMIEREVQLNPRLDDIKRGQGGIREVEFIIQSVQLIRGGRLPQLRSQNALTALAAIKSEQLLPRCGVLKQAYLFLRRLENVIQSLNDQQTHSLPEDEIKQTQVTLAMGYDTWSELVEKLHQYQRIISNSFRTILGSTDDYADAERLLAHQFNSIWHGHVETSMAINLLTSSGFTNAEHCYQMLHTFRHGSRCRRLSQAARLRLGRFMVLLLTELSQYERTDEVLLQVIYLLESIVGRSAYLALLTENTQAFKELLFWFSRSPYITSLLVHHPFLLEVLLDQQQDWRPYTRKELEKKLQAQLAHANDIETKEDLLRQFKLTYWLMAARAEIYGSSTAVRIGKFLADVAEVIVKQVFYMACEQLALRYPEIEFIKSRFAIVAYGKLGSREMNYASDLDLVFLYTANPSEEALVTRLTQKIVHMLTTRSQVGVLFTVDTRLRPSGAAGLLVSHLDSFIDYQKNQAWTWEHQALLKARVISGSITIKSYFLTLKKTMLTLERDKNKLQQDVVEMRAKIAQHQEKESMKQLSNSLLDLEFLIQFLALYAKEPKLAQYTHPLSQLKQLAQIKMLTDEEFQILKRGYQYYHTVMHQEMICSEQRAFEDELVFTRMANLCQYLYKKYS